MQLSDNKIKFKFTRQIETLSLKPFGALFAVLLNDQLGLECHWIGYMVCHYWHYRLKNAAIDAHFDRLHSDLMP